MILLTQCLLRIDAAADRRVVELQPLGRGDKLTEARLPRKRGRDPNPWTHTLAHFRTADARSLKLLCAKSWRIKPEEQSHQGAER
jgi:hypothetical protein